MQHRRRAQRGSPNRRSNRHPKSNVSQDVRSTIVTKRLATAMRIMREQKKHRQTTGVAYGGNAVLRCARVVEPMLYERERLVRAIVTEASGRVHIMTRSADRPNCETLLGERESDASL